jgi:hypothetical protein
MSELLVGATAVGVTSSHPRGPFETEIYVPTVRLEH